MGQFITVQQRQVSEKSKDFAEPDQTENTTAEIADDPDEENSEVVTGPIEEHIEMEADRIWTI